MSVSVAPSLMHPGTARHLSVAAGSRHRECPRCESRSVTRSRIRGVLGHAMKNLFGVRPYRCLDCWHRFMGVSRHHA